MTGDIFTNEHRYVSALANIRYMDLILSPPVVMHFIDVKTSPKKVLFNAIIVRINLLCEGQFYSKERNADLSWSGMRSKV